MDTTNLSSAAYVPNYISYVIPSSICLLILALILLMIYVHVQYRMIKSGLAILPFFAQLVTLSFLEMPKLFLTILFLNISIWHQTSWAKNESLIWYSTLLDHFFVLASKWDYMTIAFTRTIAVYKPMGKKSVEGNFKDPGRAKKGFKYPTKPISAFG